MSSLTTTDGALHLEGVPLSRIAREYGTPCYVYSKAFLQATYAAMATAFANLDCLICYAVKANSNLAVLNLFARLGAGFDIVSGGELERVIAAGGDPSKTVFSGVGKSAAEIRLGLARKIHCFNIESEDELFRIDDIARASNLRAPISFRVNPDVDAKTHPYIATGLKSNKFGVAYAQARALYRKAASLAYVDIRGIDCHIGSQITELTPFADAIDKLLILVDELAEDGIALEHIDIGGGLGIRYHDEEPPLIADYARIVEQRFSARKCKLILEPGRALVGNAGVLLTRVEYLKRGIDKNFAIIDAGMNDLMRPALYDAYHEILAADARNQPEILYDVVGPVCESADFFGRRLLAIEQNDLLAILSAGAYGISMASHYNTRPAPPEVMVDGNDIYEIRPREKIAELFSSEKLLP